MANLKKFILCPHFTKKNMVPIISILPRNIKSNNSKMVIVKQIGMVSKLGPWVPHKLTEKQRIVVKMFMERSKYFQKSSDNNRKM